MKLLTKREIDIQKNLERKTEIDQGTILAKKVDTLRELSAKTETEYEKYRVESLKEVQREINEKIAVRDEIDQEIEQKRAKLLLLEPLERNFANYTKEERGKIALENEKIGQKWEEVKLYEQDLFEKEKILDEKDSDLVKNKNIFIEKANKIIEKEKKTAENLKNAEKKSAQMEKEAELHLKQAKEQHAEAAVIIRELELKEMKLNNMRKDLEERETQVILKELQYYSPIKTN